MIDKELEARSAPSASGESHLGSVALAEAELDNVDAQISAAYARDQMGREQDAIRYYERAWALGIPTFERRNFLLGFGSTLRNVGRAREAVAILRDAVEEYPRSPELLAFLALALHSAGDSDLALATMLDAAFNVLGPEGFGPYSRALTEYRAELIAVHER